MLPVQQAYLVPLPGNLPANPCNFTFNVNVNGTTFPFTMKWAQSIEAVLPTPPTWEVFVKFPDGSTRQAGMIPGIVSWSAYTDWAFYCQSSLETIGQNDLGNVNIYMLDLSV